MIDPSNLVGQRAGIPRYELPTEAAYHGLTRPGRQGDEGQASVRGRFLQPRAVTRVRLTCPRLAHVRAVRRQAFIDDR